MIENVSALPPTTTEPFLKTLWLAEKKFFFEQCEPRTN